MNKKLKKNILIYGGVFLLALIIIFSTKFYLNEPEKETSLNLSNIHTNNTPQENLVNDKFSNTTEVHWTHMPITYRINFSAYNDKEKIKYETLNIKYALERIHNAIPYITFKEVNDSEDISFVGEISLDILSQTDNFGGMAIPNVSGKYIKHFTIYISEFFINNKEFLNSYPSDLGVHEILHAFGIQHDNVIGGIMYPMVSSIPLTIEEGVVSCLNYIYSNGSYNGNCSKANLYCEEGYVFGNDYKCHKQCDEGYIFDDNYRCQEKCGNGYCPNGGVCKDELCYNTD